MTIDLLYKYFNNYLIFLKVQKGLNNLGKKKKMRIKKFKNNLTSEQVISMICSPLY